MTGTQEFSDISGIFASSTQMIQECKGKVYGYLRVSTQQQSHERQIAAMKEFGVEENQMFFDKRTGKNFDRPGYSELLKKLQPGDLIVIKNLDRLGRNTTEAKEQWRILTKEKQVSIVVIDTPVLNAGKELGPLGEAISDIVLTIFSLVADFDRFSIIQRTQEGIQNAVKNGKKLGRKPLTIPKEFYAIKEKYKNNELSQRAAANALNVSRGTFLKWIAQTDTEKAVKKS